MYNISIALCFQLVEYSCYNCCVLRRCRPAPTSVICYLCQVPASGASCLQFAGQTVSGGCLLLLTVDLDQATVTVNTEKIVLGSMLLKEVKAELERV